MKVLRFYHRFNTNSNNSNFRLMRVILAITGISPNVTTVSKDLATIKRHVAELPKNLGQIRAFVTSGSNIFTFKDFNLPATTVIEDFTKVRDGQSVLTFHAWQALQLTYLG